MSIVTDTSALTQAVDYLRDHSRLDYHVRSTEGDGAVWWTAEGTVPCPLDGLDDVTLRRRATSDTRRGALELARLELTGAVARFFANPAEGERVALAVRDSFVYRHADERTLERVQRAVQARGGRRPVLFEVNAARIHLGAKPDLTVGQVADQVVATQREAGPYPGQVALL